MLDVVMGVMDMEVDKVANIMVNNAFDSTELNLYWFLVANQYRWHDVKVMIGLILAILARNVWVIISKKEIIV